MNTFYNYQRCLLCRALLPDIRLVLNKKVELKNQYGKSEKYILKVVAHGVYSPELESGVKNLVNNYDSLSKFIGFVKTKDYIKAPEIFFKGVPYGQFQPNRKCWSIQYSMGINICCRYLNGDASCMVITVTGIN